MENQRKTARKQAEGAGVAENKNVVGASDSFIRMSEAFLSMDVRKFAAFYIEFIENLTKQFLEFQETALGWAKETPLGPFVEFQTSISRKLAETSINTARSIWQIETETSQ
jgi:hypothetical protein